MFAKEVGQANKQRRAVGPNVRFFCSQQCCGASKRDGKSKEQRVAEKAAYDRDYRGANQESRKAQKRAYHERTYDPAAARTERERKREYHRAYKKEYGARAGWKEKKREYDKQLRAMEYGEFAECQMLLVDLEKAVRAQPWYERAKERGYYDNDRSTQQRKRNEQVSRW